MGICWSVRPTLITIMLGKLSRTIAQQSAGAVFCGAACVLTGLHPFIHHFEGGTLDAIFDYLYVASLDAMNRTTN